MDRTEPALDKLHALELRVLDGPQRGASAPLASGTSWVLAAGSRAFSVDADIVLHEEGAAPARVRVSAEMSHALIEVLHGEVRLGEQVLAAGAQAVWPRQTPLHIGSSVVAYGLSCVDEWKAAMAASQAPGDVPVAAGAAPPASARTRHPARCAPLRRRAEVWLAATGTAVLLACL